MSEAGWTPRNDGNWGNAEKLREIYETQVRASTHVPRREFDAPTVRMDGLVDETPPTVDRVPDGIMPLVDANAPLLDRVPDTNDATEPEKRKIYGGVYGILFVDGVADVSMFPFGD